MTRPSSPPRSLVQRIMLSFALLVTLIAGLYAAALHQSMEFTETHLIAGVLEDEVIRITQQLDSGLTPTLSNETSIYGAPPLRPIPAPFQGLQSGFTELTDEGDYFVYTARWKDAPFVLVRDQEGFEDTERAFKRIVIISVGLVFLIGLLAGWWLSRNIMKPVRELSAAVREASTSPVYKPLSVDVTNDEVGELAHICDMALRRLHDALEREKAFTGDVSHELRTPLTVIETSLELLSMTTLTPAQITQVARIQRSTDSMRELVQLFLSFARLSQREGTSEPDTVDGILKTAIETWRPFAEEKGLTLIHRRDGVCPGTHSPVLLGTVVNNLLKNAVTYSQEGTVTVTETSDGFVVSDTGPGLQAGEAARIFGHGIRGIAAAQDHEGTGLGLSIVSRICRRMNWRIEMPPVEQGAAFAVMLSDIGDTERSDRRVCE